MSGKLTKAQRAHLVVIADWSAPYEVRERMASAGLKTSGGVALDKLVKAGLAEYGPANNTYRVTPEGRAALAEGEVS